MRAPVFVPKVLVLHWAWDGKRLAELDTLQVPRLPFIVPPFPKPESSASPGWVPLSERQMDVSHGRISPERLRELLEGSAVPGQIVARHFKKATETTEKGDVVKPSASTVDALKIQTLLSAETIHHIYDKLSGKLKLAAGRVGDESDAVDAPIIGNNRCWTS